MLNNIVQIALLGSLATEILAATGYKHVESVKRGYKRWTSNRPQVTVSGSTCTVMPLGGGQDDAPNILYAMNELCKEDALIELPGYYTIQTVLKTKMKNVEVRLGGAISYVPNLPYWNSSSIELAYQDVRTYWFFEGHGVTFHGGGTITGNGHTWWEWFAQNRWRNTGSTITFINRPILLTVGNSSNVVVKDLSFLYAPNWNNLVYQSTDITYDNIQMSSVAFNASAPATNSDGWDTYRSSFVTIKNSKIDNKDDCVSFKPNSTFITVENMVCNGSHGISVGSLGQYYGETDIVSDLYIRNISMINASDGVRIKVFGGANGTSPNSGGGTGYVRNVTYEDFRNDDVDNPIYITQCYATSAEQCQRYPSTLKISDVHFIDITGTASGVVPNSTVATLSCSATCEDFTATGTDLRPKNGTARFLCSNVADQEALDFQCTNVPVTKG